MVCPYSRHMASNNVRPLANSKTCSKYLLLEEERVDHGSFFKLSRDANPTWDVASLSKQLEVTRRPQTYKPFVVRTGPFTVKVYYSTPALDQPPTQHFFLEHSCLVNNITVYETNERRWWKSGFGLGGAWSKPGVGPCDNRAIYCITGLD